MLEIPLINGGVALVDDEDYERLAGYRWRRMLGYARRSNAPGQYPRSIAMHREVIGAEPSQIVDHINRNPLDNRRANLRIATHAQNAANWTKTNGASRYRGVALNHKSKRTPWKVVLHHGGRVAFQGTFADEIEAARAYDIAALAIHGEFAHLNFPREEYGAAARSA